MNLAHFSRINIQHGIPSWHPSPSILPSAPPPPPFPLFSPLMTWSLIILLGPLMCPLIRQLREGGRGAIPHLALWRHMGGGGRIAWGETRERAERVMLMSGYCIWFPKQGERRGRAGAFGCWLLIYYVLWCFVYIWFSSLVSPYLLVFIIEVLLFNSFFFIIIRFYIFTFKI